MQYFERKFFFNKKFSVMLIILWRIGGHSALPFLGKGRNFMDADPSLKREGQHNLVFFMLNLTLVCFFISFGRSNNYKFINTLKI